MKYAIKPQHKENKKTAIDLTKIVLEHRYASFNIIINIPNP